MPQDESVQAARADVQLPAVGPEREMSVVGGSSRDGIGPPSYEVYVAEMHLAALSAASASNG